MKHGFTDEVTVAVLSHC